MKNNLAIFTKTALTLTLISGVTPVNAQEADTDIYLDALDADGHLSIHVSVLEAKEKEAETVAQEIKAEPQALEIAASEVIQKPQAAKTKLETVAANILKEDKAEAKSSIAASTDKENYNSKVYAEVAAAPTAEAQEKGGDKGYDAGSSGKGFLTKTTTEIEFTFAILIIVVGLIASERFQREKDQEVHASESELNGLRQVGDS